MRLDCVDHGHKLLDKVKLKMIGLVSRKPPPDVMKTLMYRPDYFGRPFSAWVHEILRGPSEWSVGERELFAALTSKLNECRF